jgi:methionyl-tRNA formyltransferase
MTTEIFLGTPEALKARLDALIGGGSTINQVVTTAQRGKYLIMYT